MQVELETTVETPVDRVWQRIITPEGINHELRPWLRMSMPPGHRDLTIETVQVGRPVGRCWLRLFGVIPFDYDNLTLVEVRPGRGFVEESTMFSMRRWRHERTLDPIDDDHTRVRDHITFELRAPLRILTPVVGTMIRTLFSQRHRRLAVYFANMNSTGTTERV